MDEAFSEFWVNMAREHAARANAPIFLRRCFKTKTVSIGLVAYWQTGRPKLAVLPNGDEVPPLEAINRYFRR